jgi:alanine racemase
MSKTRETVLEIDLHSLHHNFKYLKSKIRPETKFMAVVKANAYGSDAVAVAKFLESKGVDYFAVAYTSEGVELRQAGVKTPILVLHPQSVNFEVLIDYCLEPALYSEFVFKAFEAAARQKNQVEYPVHVKFNTGLNRLGFDPSDIELITSFLSATTSIKIKSVFSHLAASEDWGEENFTRKQIESFTSITKRLTAALPYKPIFHLLNTSGILNYPEAQFDMVRSGIGLYGFGNSVAEDAKLRPISTLKTIVSQLHTVSSGESVGYNRGFVAEHQQVTATLPIGHADGLSRRMGKGVGYVCIGGQKAPYIGNVCMDMIMVNVTGIDCAEGDEAIVFGKNPSAETLAQLTGTISYEFLTKISKRIKRVII